MEIRSNFLHLLTYVRAEGSSDFSEHTAGMRTCLGSIALHCLIRRFLSERTFIMVVILYISALKGVHCSSSPSDWVGKVASGIHRVGGSDRRSRYSEEDIFQRPWWASNFGHLFTEPSWFLYASKEIDMQRSVAFNLFCEDSLLSYYSYYGPLNWIC
jgi:hypothetical protein